MHVITNEIVFSLSISGIYSLMFYTKFISSVRVVCYSYLWSYGIWVSYNTMPENINKPYFADDNSNLFFVSEKKLYWLKIHWELFLSSSNGLVPNWGPFYWHGLFLIPAWISNHMPSKVWGEISYPFANFNGCIFKAWEWIKLFIPLKKWM